VEGIINEIGAGQPTCKPGPLPANCTGRLRSNTKPTSQYCASFCIERDEFLRVPGRGGFHDPDMLLAGETPCTPNATHAGMKVPSQFLRFVPAIVPTDLHAADLALTWRVQCNVLPLPEQQTQMALWSMASAPLLLSADLTNVPNDSMTILTNPEVLAINQDAAVRMGFRFGSDASSGVDLWRKDLVGGDVAVAVVYMGSAKENAQHRGDAAKDAAVKWVETTLIYNDTGTDI